MCVGRLGVHLRHVSLLVIQVEMLSLPSLEFSGGGEFIAGKEHLGIVSEQMVLKIVRLEIITKGVNVNRKEK